MATGTRDEDREFDISGLDFNPDSEGPYWEGPLGIASDGDTMWVASDSENAGNRLYALDMATKAREPEADIAVAVGQALLPQGAVVRRPDRVGRVVGESHGAGL